MWRKSRILGDARFIPNGGGIPEGKEGHNIPLRVNGIKSGVPAEKSLIFRWGINRGPRREIFDFSVGFNFGVSIKRMLSVLWGFIRALHLERVGQI